MERRGCFDDGVFGEGAVRMAHPVETRNTIPFLELKDFQAYCFDNAGYIISSVEGFWFG